MGARRGCPRSIRRDATHCRVGGVSTHARGDCLDIRDSDTAIAVDIGAARGTAGTQAPLPGEGHFHDVVISTLPRQTSKWLRRGLIRRVEGLGLPVTAIVPTMKSVRDTIEESADVGRGIGLGGGGAG